MIYVAWYLVSSLGIKNGKQLMKWNTWIIANWVLKLRIKISRCCIILNNMLKNLPVMMDSSTGNLKPLDLKKFLLPESNEVDDINKASETVFALKWVRPTTAIPVTDSSTDTPCPPEVERLATTVSVTSETTNSNSLLPNTASNDIQQHVNSANSCAGPMRGGVQPVHGVVAWRAKKEPMNLWSAP